MTVARKLIDIQTVVRLTSGSTPNLPDEKDAERKRKQRGRQTKHRALEREGYVHLGVWVERARLKERMILNEFIGPNVDPDRDQLQWGLQDICDDWLE